MRRDRPQLEQLRAESAGTLSPREIQARIRAGATTQEVADSAGPAPRARPPVRGTGAGRARARRGAGTRHARGRESGRRSSGTSSPTGSRPAASTCLARVGRRPRRQRTVGGPRAVHRRRRRPRGPLDLRPVKRTVVADEDEARWLSETELPTSPSRVGTSPPSVTSCSTSRRDGSLRPRRPSPPRSRPEPVPDPQEETAPLLDDLRSRRGVRQAVELDDDTEEFEGFGPQHAFDFGRPDGRARRPPVDAAPRPRRPSSTRPRRPSPNRSRTRAAEHDDAERPADGAPRSRQGPELGRDRVRRQARVALSARSGLSSPRSPASAGSASDAPARAAAVMRRMWWRRHSTSYPTPSAPPVDVTDDHLRALDDHDAADRPGVVRGPATAPAQRLHLQHLDPVGQLDQPRRAGEQPGAEVGRDAEREDVDVQLVDDPGQLLHLRRGVELRLVADQVVDGADRASAGGMTSSQKSV